MSVVKDQEEPVNINRVLLQGAKVQIMIYKSAISKIFMLFNVTGHGVRGQDGPNINQNVKTAA